MSVRRKVLAFFDQHPVAETFCELFVILVVSVGPLFLASFGAMLKDPSFSWIVFWRNVHGYLAAGELSLLVLSVCGGILWLAFVRKSYRGVVARTFYGVFAFLVAPAISTVVIAGNPGFDSTLPNWVFGLLVGLYALTLVVWIFASLQSPVSKDIERAERRPDEIIEEANS